jgi:hypothetical protein
VTIHRIAPNPLKYFGVEYSIKNNSVHRRTLENVIENNLENLKKGESSDYVLVGLLPSREAADWFIEQFNPTIAAQAQEAFASYDWQRITDVIEILLQRTLDRDWANTENGPVKFDPLS